MTTSNDSSAAPAARPRARFSDLVLRYVAIAGAVFSILTLALVGRAVWRTSPRLAATANAPTLPLIQLAEIEADRADTTAKLRVIDRGIESTTRAIAELARDPWQLPVEQRVPATYARTYLIRHEVPASEQKWLLYSLLSPQNAWFNEDDFRLLEKCGGPTYGPALARKAPPHGLLGPWFALLDKWQTPPSEEALAELFLNRKGSGVKLELAARKQWPNRTALRALITVLHRDPTAGDLVGVLDDVDSWTLRVIAVSETSLPIPAAWVAAASRSPPSPEIRSLGVELLGRYFNRVNRFEEVEVLVPLLMTWNEPKFWEAAERIVRDESRRVGDQKESDTNASSRRRAIERLVAFFERTPSEPVGRLLEALGPPTGKQILWAVDDLARRRPDLAQQAKIVLTPRPGSIAGGAASGTAPTGGTPAGGTSTGGPATGGGAGPVNLQETLATLSSDSAPDIAAACTALSKAVPDDARRDEVLNAIAAHLAREDAAVDAARIAYCQWAAPSAEKIVEQIGMRTQKPPVQAAAVRALVRFPTARLALVARVHVTSSVWTPELQEAWAAGGERSEEAICQAMVARSAREAPSRDALAFLGKHGGPRALNVLKNLGAPPGIDQAALGAAIRELESRLRSKG